MGKDRCCVAVEGGGLQHSPPWGNWLGVDTARRRAKLGLWRNEVLTRTGIRAGLSRDDVDAAAWAWAWQVQYGESLMVLASKCVLSGS